MKDCLKVKYEDLLSFYTEREGKGTYLQNGQHTELLEKEMCQLCSVFKAKLGVIVLDGKVDEVLFNTEGHCGQVN